MNIENPIWKRLSKLAYAYPFTLLTGLALGTVTLGTWLGLTWDDPALALIYILWGIVLHIVVSGLAWQHEKQELGEPYEWEEEEWEEFSQEALSESEE